MDREIVEKKVEALEKRVRWQMRALIGLIIVFLFNTSPAFTSKWFHRLLPSKLTSLNLSPDKSGANTSFRDMASHREKILARRIQAPELGPDRDKTEFINNILSRQAETPRLGKQVQAGEQEVVFADTLLVNTIQARTLEIVNASRGVVAVIGSDATGDGILLVGNANGEAVAAISVDQSGNGDISVLKNNAFVAGMGVDRAGNGLVSSSNASGSSFTLLSTGDSGNAEVFVGTASESNAGGVILSVDNAGNGSVGAVSALGSIVGLGIDTAGDAAVLVSNKEGVLASVLGVDENGHGALGIFNVSGRPIAAMAADDTGNGLLGIQQNASGQPFAAMGIDDEGNSVLGIFNASGQPFVAMGDDAGNGALEIEGGKFRAYVNTAGNGVAETRGQNETIRWSSETPSVGSGGTPSGLIGDLDQDGDVDFSDFLIFTSNFGKTSG